VVKSSRSLLLLIALSTLGCQKPTVPGPGNSAKSYAYSDIKGPSVEEEIRFYEQRCKERPTSWADKVFLANAYLTKAQAEDNDELFGKAEKLATEVLKTRPEIKDAQLVLAHVSEGHHNFKGSYEICHKLYKQDPNDLALYSMISNSLLEMGEVEEAGKWAKPLVERASSTGILVHAARIAIYQGEDDRAAKYLEAALKLEQPQERKSSARIRSLWGDIHLRHGRLKEARELLEVSLGIHKRSLPALLALARLERREGKPDRALQLLREAHAYFGNPAILTEMALMEERLGNAEQARTLRKQATDILREEVGSGLIGHARDLAKVLLDQGQHAEALKVLQEEQKYRRDHRNFELQAMAYEGLNKPKEGLMAMEKALQHGYQDPALFARAARIAAQAQDPRSGQWEKRAKELDPGFSLDQ